MRKSEKNSEKGFAIVVALLFVAVMSSAAATAFFISVSDLKISFNRVAASRSLRDAERAAAEALMHMEQCVAEKSVAKCAAETGDFVNGAEIYEAVPDEEFNLSAEGHSGKFSAEINAKYLLEEGKMRRILWRQKVESPGD